MTEREKIAQIIAEHLCPQGRAHKTLYGAERMCYSRNNFADCEKVSECVDALTDAGIGDVSWWERKCKLCEEDWFLQKKQIEHYAESYKELLQEDLDKYKHRAEVAERALLDCIKDSRPAHCSIAVCSKWTRCGDDACVETRKAMFIEQAEKELAEGKKDD